MKSTNTLVLDRSAAGLQIKETTVLLGIAALLPFAVHFLPAAGASPWGALLLPMFYAPFIGAALYRLHVGLIPALLAPTLNVLLTGLPQTGFVVLLTVELALFTLAAYGLLRWKRNLYVAAPLAYLLAKIASGALVGLLPMFAALQPATDFAIASFTTAVPGLLVLLLINAVVVHLRRDEN